MYVRSSLAARLHVSIHYNPTFRDITQNLDQSNMVLFLVFEQYFVSPAREIESTRLASNLTAVSTYRRSREGQKNPAYPIYEFSVQMQIHDNS